MKQHNPLFFLFKRLSWPYGLIITAVIISSLGSLSGLLIPLFTGRLVDKFSTNNINWNIVVLFASIFIINALLSGLGIYLLSKIGEKMIYGIRSLLWEHMIKLKMPFFDKNESGQLMSYLSKITTITTSYYHIDWFYYYAVYYGLANDFTDFHSYSNIYGYYDSTWKTYAKNFKTYPSRNCQF